ncbi:MAG TPA: hypothetical protein PLF40_05160 [Kofleriaceae bacterium]|nr:hypothetical protein [Kofleriaceae bacterium]
MPLPRRVSDLLQERAARLPRIWSNDVLRTIAPHFGGEVINVSGWKDSDKNGDHYRSYFSSASKYYLSNFAGHSGLADAAAITDFALDLEAPLPAELKQRFDTVFNHTALEHIFDTQTAFANLCAMARDAVVLVVPFAQKMHYTESFGDYWRFTPQAMRRLFERQNMSVVYEAGNNTFNASVYLIVVGVRDAAKWQGKLPAYRPLTQLAQWIGKNPARSLARRIGLVGATARDHE